MSYEEELKKVTERLAEIDRAYRADFSEESLKRSNISRQACANRTQREWDEIGRSVSHGMANMPLETREKWRSDLSKGVRETYARRNLAIEMSNVSNAFGEWFAGFYEGDGSAGIHEAITNNGTGITYSPSIEFVQEDDDVVEYLAAMLPGSCLSWVKRVQRDYRHVKWSGQKRCVPVLKLLAQHIVSDFRVIQLNTVLKSVGLPTTCVHDMSMLWVVGFWDAEGSVYRRNGDGAIQLNIAQKNVLILQRIREFLKLDLKCLFIPEDIEIPGKVAILNIGIRDECLGTLCDAIIAYSRIERKRKTAKDIWGDYSEK